METTKEYRKVQRGAAWLDKVRPGWADEIDLERLVLMDGASCILGQLYDGYGTVVGGLWPCADQLLTERGAVLLGFNVGESVPHQQRVFEELEFEWRLAVKERGGGHGRG